MSSISSPMSASFVNQNCINRESKETRGFSYLALLLFLFILSAALQSAVPAIDVVRPAQLLAIFAIGTAIIGKFVNNERYVFKGPSLLISMFICITVLSVPGALWPGEAFKTANDALKILAIFLVLTNVVTSVNKLNGVAWALCLGGLVAALGTIKSYFAGEYLVDGFRAAWVGIYGNPNDLSYILAMLTPLAMALVASTRRLWAKLLGVGCIGSYTLAIFFTVSRMGFLCMVMIGVMTMLRSQQRFRNFLMLIVLGMLCLPLVPSKYWERVETISDYDKDTSSVGRLVAWEAGLEMVQENPFLGVGAGCYVLGWPDELKNKYGISPRSAHNTFFQALGELGILGFVTFCAFLVSSWILVWKLKRALLAKKRGLDADIFNQDYGRLLLMVTAVEIGFWVFMVSSLTGGLLFSWYPYLFSAMGIAALEIYNRKQAEEKSQGLSSYAEKN